MSAKTVWGGGKGVQGLQGEEGGGVGGFRTIAFLCFLFRRVQKVCGQKGDKLCT